MLIAFPFESFICLSAEIPGLIPRNAIHFSPTESWTVGGVKGELPTEGPSFWTWQPGGLWMWTMAKEKALGGNSGSMEASQREQWVHVTGVDLRGVSHRQSMFRCACAPHYQRNNVVKLPTALCRCAGASSQDLAQDCSLKAVLWPPLSSFPLGPITLLSTTQVLV